MVCAQLNITIVVILANLRSSTAPAQITRRAINEAKPAPFLELKCVNSTDTSVISGGAGAVLFRNVEAGDREARRLQMRLQDAELKVAALEAERRQRSERVDGAADAYKSTQKQISDVRKLLVSAEEDVQTVQTVSAEFCAWYTDKRDDPDMYRYLQAHIITCTACCPRDSHRSECYLKPNTDPTVLCVCVCAMRLCNCSSHYASV